MKSKWIRSRSDSPQIFYWMKMDYILEHEHGIFVFNFGCRTTDYFASLLIITKILITICVVSSYKLSCILPVCCLTVFRSKNSTLFINVSFLCALCMLYAFFMRVRRNLHVFAYVYICRGETNGQARFNADTRRDNNFLCSWQVIWK